MDADVIVVGSGQAGVPLAVRLAALGQRVLVAERGAPGGTCVNVGCTPTKTLVASARAAHVARGAGRLGVRVEAVAVDFPAVIARKDGIVRQWREGVEKKLSGRPERLTLLRGHARFVGPRAVEVGGEVHRAPAVVIDVGCRPRLPPLPGLDAVPFLTNRTIMELAELPRRLLILGGGYVGCEFAQMFRRFGAEVVQLDHHPHLLAREDEEVSVAIEQVFAVEGIELVLGVSVERAERSGGGLALRLAGGRTLTGSHLLVATGRRPNTDDLGCDAAGVKLDEQGFVVVDDLWRTAAEGVYAVGDVCGGPQFTHTAWDDHRLLFDVLTGRGRRGRAGRVVPSVVFTDPQVARVGLSEGEARRRGLRYEVATLPFGRIARAVEVDEPAGVVKLLLDPATELFLGAAVVGAEGGELIHLFSTLMQAKVPARAIVEGEYAHPSFSEGMQSAVMQFPRYALS